MRTPYYPPVPDFSVMDNDELQETFGKYDYTNCPLPRNPERIVIEKDWKKANLVLVKIPGFDGVFEKKRVVVHRKVEKQFINLWQSWKSNNLLKKVLSWNGSFSSRFIRGSNRNLSSHAFGIAFDINHQWNLFGEEPAPVGELGSVVELVNLANAHGFFWGGHFSRPDGMHFEVGMVQ